MTVSDTIIDYIQTQLTHGSMPINLDTNLTEGHVDSTAMLELILWVGDTFNIIIQNEDLTPENFATPRNILEFVQQHTSKPEVNVLSPNRIAEPAAR